MIDENIINLQDIKIYSKELLEYIEYNFFMTFELKEILVYFKSAISEIDNINDYILELESKINELEQNSYY